MAIEYVSLKSMVIERDGSTPLEGYCNRSTNIDRPTRPIFWLFALCFSASMRLPECSGKIRAKGIHLAIVMDEYGSVSGIVSLTDVLEALVGDIPHIEVLDEPQIMRRDDGSWLVDGAVPIQDLKEVLQIGQFPKDDEGLYQTAGGFIMTTMEKVPATGEYLDWEKYRFEVVDMDGQRVDKILITIIALDGLQDAL
jgi:CBS domain containing-hemolysin-like protein